MAIAAVGQLMNGPGIKGQVHTQKTVGVQAQYLRLNADFENFRRRAATDKDATSTRVKAKTIEARHLSCALLIELRQVRTSAMSAEMPCTLPSSQVGMNMCIAALITEGQC